MAARGRHLVSTLPSSSQRQHITTELPEYQPAQFTLNADAQRLFHELTTKHKFDSLSRSLAETIDRISNSATDINERVSEHRQRLLKKRAHTAEVADGENNEDQERGESSTVDTELLEVQAEKLTKRMDSYMRKLIDSQQSIVLLKESLANASTHARSHASTQASIPPTARPLVNNNVEDGDNDDHDEENEQEEDDYVEFEPTAPSNSTQQITGPSIAFREQLETRQQRYKDLSLAARYADNTSYRNFKDLVHNALHPDQEVPPPPPSQWFQEQPPARPGVTQAGADQDDGSDEEDIQMTRAITSTKCPITLQEFKQPLTSNKCPHTYEGRAIHQLIQTSATRAPPALGRGNVRAVQCPVQGCTNLLTMSDLHEDAIILRRIKRLQRARELEEEAMQDGIDTTRDGTQCRALLLEEDGYDVDEIEDDETPAPSKRIKREMRSSMK